MQRLIARCAVALVIAALAGGIVASAPWEARDRANDRDRVSALQSIQSEILNFWMAKGRVPTTLTELADPVRGFVVPVDPETRDPYEYQQRGRTAFTLCAVFATPSRGSIGEVQRLAPYPYGGDLYASAWDHGVGRTCFEREVDPQLYPPTKR